MILGGYQFPWRPEETGIPRAERESASVKGLGVFGFLAGTAILQSKIISLKWNFVTKAQWDQMMVLYRADELIEWDPITPWVGAKHSVGDEYANPIGQYGQRFYHGLIGFQYYVTPTKKFDVGAALYVWVPSLGHYEYYRVIASGDYWADYEMESSEDPWWQIQPGDEVGTYSDPYYLKTSSTIGINPYYSAGQYPEEAHPQRIYYHKVSGGDLVVGNNVYGDWSYLDYEIVGLGPGYIEVTALDPGYGTTAQMIQSEPLRRWSGNFSGIVDYIGNLEIPEIDVEVTPRPDVPNYNVRILSLTGDLFKVAGYDQPYRKNVEMKLLIRGEAA